MLFKRARELFSDVYHGIVQGTVRDVAKCSKIIKAIDDNNIDNLRTILGQLANKDVEDYIRRPVDSMRRNTTALCCLGREYRDLRSSTWLCR